MKLAGDKGTLAQFAFSFPLAMSIYAQFDEDGNQYQIATNKGWSLFGDWVDSLSAKEFPALVQLWEHGFTQEFKKAGDDIGRALKHHAPDENVSGIAKALLAAMKREKKANTLLITNGMTRG